MYSMLDFITVLKRVVNFILNLLAENTGIPGCEAVYKTEVG